MINLTQLSQWQALEQHQQYWHGCHLRDLFANNPQRFQAFSFQLDTILFDFSKHYLTDETLHLLVELAKARELDKKIAALFSGQYYCANDKNPALHVALRHPEPSFFSTVSTYVLGIRKKMHHFVTQVRNGEWRGYSNKPITDIVHVGVGGSLLGPMMVTNALSNYVSKLNIHFIASLDGEQTARLLTKLDPATTLFMIVSKTFTTEDTLTNATILKEWFLREVLDPNALQKHFFAVSANVQAMTAFGISPDNQFELGDFIGGRYSVWSAVGLTVALAIGMEQFDAFLMGAHGVDQHVQTTPLARNIPVIMALLTIWYRNFMHYTSQAILPYDSHLENFPAYLQQLEMESCGKQVTQMNTTVNYKTSSVIWGDIGSNGEHAFFQLLHQGTDIIPVDFIVPIHSVHNLNGNQALVLARALAQAQALMLGTPVNETIAPSMATQQYYPGNKPSTMILFPKLTPHVLGALLACYELKVFAQSMVWDINPFEQWGVELGKQLSKKLLPFIRKQTPDAIALDSSTHGLLKFIEDHG